MTFKDDILADLDILTDPDEFGDPATWNGTTVNGIFDNEFELAELGDISVEGTAPAFQCPSAKVVGIAQGNPFTVKGGNYKVVREQPDGTGWSIVILEDA